MIRRIVLSTLLLLCLLSRMACAEQTYPALNVEIEAVTLDTPALLYYMAALSDGGFVLAGSHAQAPIVFTGDTLSNGTVFEAYAVCIDLAGEQRWTLTRWDPELGSSHFRPLGAMTDGRLLLAFNPKSQTDMGSAYLIISEDGATSGELSAGGVDMDAVQMVGGMFYTGARQANAEEVGDLIFFDESLTERFRIPLEDRIGWGYSAAEGNGAFYLAGYYIQAQDLESAQGSGASSKTSPPASRLRGTSLLKISKDGELLWEKAGEVAPENKEWLSFPIALADGGAAYVRRSFTEESGSVKYRYTLQGIDADGNPAFTHALPDGLYGVLPLGNGFLAVAPYDTTQDTFGNTLVLTYLDAEGNAAARLLTFPESMASTPFGAATADGNALLCVATTSEPEGTARRHYPSTYRYVRLTPELFT